MRSTCRPSTFWTKATRGPLAPRLSEPAWAGEAVQSTSTTSAAIDMRPRVRRVALPTYDSVCSFQTVAYEVSCRARACALLRQVAVIRPRGRWCSRFGSPVRRTRRHGDSAGVVLPAEIPALAGFLAERANAHEPPRVR